MTKDLLGDDLDQKKKKNEWFDDWFVIFKDTYPSDSSKGGKFYNKLLWNTKGSTEKAKDYCQKYIKTEQKANEVLNSLREQIRYAREERKNNSIKPFYFPMITTYCNQKQWSNEIGSYYEMHQDAKLRTCSWEGCNDVTHGPRFRECSYHVGLKSHKQSVKTNLIQKGLWKRTNETKEQWIARQREYIRNNKGKIL